MKILVTIPHYYSHDPQGIYASNGDPERKAKNLRKLIVHLKTLFESPQAYCRYDLQNAEGSRFTVRTLVEPPVLRRAHGRIFLWRRSSKSSTQGRVSWGRAFRRSRRSALTRRRLRGKVSIFRFDARNIGRKLQVQRKYCFR